MTGGWKTGVSSRPLRVLQSFQAPRGTSNPYVTQLLQGLEARVDVEVDSFTFRRLLTGRYDVFHVHWPDVLLRGSSPTKTLVRRVLVGGALVVLAVRRTVVVRTVHNVVAHEGHGRVEGWLVRGIDRRTRGWVHLNAWTPRQGPGPVVVILHGHYRDWYRGRPVPDPVPGRLLMLGQLRRYKGVQPLLAAMAAARSDVSLRLVGHAADDTIVDLVRRAETADPRVTTALGRFSDDVVPTEIGRAQVVVLPYGSDGNSGAALLALSLRRPVLVPAGPVTDALAWEVGEAWVQRYAGDLTAAHLEAALDATDPLPPGAPDLHRRDWASAVDAHVELYRTVISRARKGRRRRWSSPVAER